MNRTISYLRADMDRAKNQGSRSLDVSILDLDEILRLAESSSMHERTGSAKKHAGWIKPGSLSMLRSGKKKFTRISQRRSDEFNTEIFFADDLKEKQLEAYDAKNPDSIKLVASQSALDAANQEEVL